MSASGLVAQGPVRAKSQASHLRAQGDPSDTATQLTLSSNPIGAGSVETLTAAVTYYGYPIAPGVVTFRDGKNIIGTAQLVAVEGASNYGTATIRMRFGIGEHSLTASYFAADGFDPSSSPAQTLTVTGVHPTTKSIAKSGSAGNYTLKATVAGSGSLLAPTGDVSFFDVSDANYFLAAGPLAHAKTSLGFSNAVNLPVGPGWSIVTADFNGDGIPDVAADGNGTVTIYLGNGDGTFTGPITVEQTVTYQFDSGMAVGDFNDDGIPDIAVASYLNNTVTILLGNGDGTFTAVPQAAGPVFNATSIAVADFNGDGILDLAASNLGQNQVAILLGNGDGTFRAGTPATTAPGSISYGLTAGDFNGDGKIDIAVSNAIGAGTENGNEVNILLGSGDGTFTLSAQSPATGQNPYGGVVADFNQDGKLDLAIPNELDGTVTVLLGNGDGTFSTVPETPAAGAYPVQLAVGDFNGDGIPDLAAADFFGNELSILLGKGDGTFPLDPLSPSTGQEPAGVATADFNGDGLSDLATTLQYLADPPQLDPVQVFLTQLTVTETAEVKHIAPPGLGTHEVNASYQGDLNYGPSVSGVVALKGELLPTTLTLSANPTSGKVGETVTLTAKLSPWYSEAYSTDGETVTFSYGSTVVGTGTLSQGVAQVQVSSLPAGTHTLKASYAGDPQFKAASATLKFDVKK